MNREECIQFLNGDGHLLRGILHYGNTDKCKRVSIICLNTGLNDMVGWYRIQVKMSRYLAEEGYNVFRFDDHGIGDSEGNLEEESIVRIFSEIERGLFVQNANAATDLIGNKFKGDKLVYIGFCGGGLTAIHSAVRNKKIAGLVDIGGPITLSSTEYLDKVDPWEVRKNLQTYRSKVFRLAPWIRFLSGKGDYRTVFKSILYFIKHHAGGMYKERLNDADLKDVKNLNQKFFQSFETYMRSSRPILFYFAEVDSATWEFKKYFWSKCEAENRPSSSKCAFIEVEKANHIFSGVDSQEKMKQDLSNWLSRNFS
jgi:pimeloyl-ACP methyl ester carboxylesterase